MDDGNLGQPGSLPTVDALNARGVQVGQGNSQQNTYHYHGVPVQVEVPGQAEDRAAQPATTTSGIGFGGVVVAVVIVLVVLGCYNWINGAPEPKSSFPAENGQRPAGATNEAVLGAALDALRGCTAVPVLKPVHCPQQIGDLFTGDVTRVSWRLHGDPGDGARIVFNGEESRFHVLGTAVMTVSYEETQRSRLRLRVVHYWARVEWAGSQPKVAEIRAYDDSPKPPTEKRDLGWPNEVVFPLVERAFQQCASADALPLPPECPTSKHPVQVDNAEWKLNGNPLVNARAKFDPSSGLVHVIGNYSLTVAYDAWPAGVTSHTDSGKYDAVVSIDEGKPTVLRIHRS